MKRDLVDIANADKLARWERMTDVAEGLTKLANPDTIPKSLYPSESPTTIKINTEVNPYRKDEVSVNVRQFLGRFPPEIQEEFIPLFASLNSQLEEIEALIILQEMIEEQIQQNGKFDSYLKFDYVRFPVGMEEFIESRDYLGLKGEIFPQLKDDLCELFDPDKNYIEAIWTGGIGYGKLQRYSDLVMTPNGYTTMGSLKVGDQVVTPDNTIERVLQIHEQGVVPIYRITFNDRTFTYCGKDHLWKVRTDKDKSKNRWRVLTTKEIMEKGLIREYGKRNNIAARKWDIPVTKPIQFSKRKHLIPPYVVGALLGDGCFRSNNEIRITNPDAKIIDRIKKELPNYSMREYRKDTWCPYYVLQAEKGNSLDDPMRDELIRLNLWGKYSHEKFIPEEYLIDSIENRRALLQGLMDTDGSVDNRSHAIFSTTGQKLNKDFTELVNGLGGVVRTYARPCERTDLNGKREQTGEDRIEYRSSVNILFNPFYLPRKAKAFKPQTKNLPNRKIADIKYAGKEKARCITLTGKDGLYLTNNYIVTHNSFSAAASCARMLYELSCLREPHCQKQNLRI